MSSDTSKRYAQQEFQGKEDVHNAIKIDKVVSQAFCKIVPDLTRTKNILHFAWGQELNPLWLTCIGKRNRIYQYGRYRSRCFVMNIDDLLCVTTDNILLSSTIGRNKT
jgi:hypothetical protein